MRDPYRSSTRVDRRLRLYLETDFIDLEVGRRSARSVAVLCPLHREKTPSLFIWHGSRRWHCFGCQRGGTLADLVARLVGHPEDPDLWDMTVPAGQLRLPFG